MEKTEIPKSVLSFFWGLSMFGLGAGVVATASVVWTLTNIQMSIAVVLLTLLFVLAAILGRMTLRRPIPTHPANTSAEADSRDEQEQSGQEFSRVRPSLGYHVDYEQHANATDD